MPRPAVAATREDWQRVAEQVRDRRSALYASQEEAAAASGGMVSTSVWGTIEAAAQKKGTVAVRSLQGVCKALGWTDDSVDRILAGGAPSIADARTVDRDADNVAARLDRVTADLETLKRLVAELAGRSAP